MNLIGLLVVILLRGVLGVVVLDRTTDAGCPADATTTTIVPGVTMPRTPGVC